LGENGCFFVKTFLTEAMAAPAAIADVKESLVSLLKLS
jgi:hypothetical protein